MKHKTIYSEECAGEILSKDDLVVTKHLIFIVPYHNSCYSKSLKGRQTAIVGSLIFL